MMIATIAVGWKVVACLCAATAAIAFVIGFLAGASGGQPTERKPHTPFFL